MEDKPLVVTIKDIGIRFYPPSDRRRKIPIRELYTILKAEKRCGRAGQVKENRPVIDIESIITKLKEDHPLYINPISPDQLKKLLLKIVDHHEFEHGIAPKAVITPVRRVIMDLPASIDRYFGKGDLNKPSDNGLDKVKKAINVKLQENQINPRNPSFLYDIQKEYATNKKKVINDWVSDADFEFETELEKIASNKQDLDVLISPLLKVANSTSLHSRARTQTASKSPQSSSKICDGFELSTIDKKCSDEFELLKSTNQDLASDRLSTTIATISNADDFERYDLEKENYLTDAGRNFSLDDESDQSAIVSDSLDSYNFAKISGKTKIIDNSDSKNYNPENEYSDDFELEDSDSDNYLSSSKDYLPLRVMSSAGH